MFVKITKKRGALGEIPIDHLIEISMGKIEKRMSFLKTRLKEEMRKIWKINDMCTTRSHTEFSAIPRNLRTYHINISVFSLAIIFF